MPALTDKLCSDITVVMYTEPNSLLDIRTEPAFHLLFSIFVLLACAPDYLTLLLTGSDRASLQKLSNLTFWSVILNAFFNLVPSEGKQLPHPMAAAKQQLSRLSVIAAIRFQKTTSIQIISFIIFLNVQSIFIWPTNEFRLSLSIMNIVVLLLYSQKYGYFLNKEAKNQATCSDSQHIFF